MKTIHIELDEKTCVLKINVQASIQDMILITGLVLNHQTDEVTNRIIKEKNMPNNDETHEMMKQLVALAIAKDVGKIIIEGLDGAEEAKEYSSGLFEFDGKDDNYD